MLTRTEDPKEQDTRRVPAATLRAFLTDAFLACGLTNDDAATVAGAMLEADLTGSDAHGVFRLAGYVRQLKRGAINPRASISVVERGPATALIDGGQGMGHVVMTHAARLAVELARPSGVGWVGARRSNHAGAGAIYAAIPLEHGMVGIYGAASSVNHMAPWGGTEPLLGTNPIAVAIPAGNEAPVILDIATSIASNGAIRTHELEGRPMPEGWVQNRADGSPITDPRRINEGTYLPIGGYKGSGLSIIIGLLAGPLNGAAFGRDIRDFAAPPGGELNVGQFVIALDVARFVPPELFKAEIDRHIRDLAVVAAAAGGDDIRVPGQGRAARRKEREQNGVPLNATLVAQVDEVAEVARHHAAQRTRMSAAEYPVVGAGIAVLAFLAPLLSPARGCRCLHRAAGGGGRRRQPAVVPALARHARAHAVADRGRGARAPHRRLARHNRHSAARDAPRPEVAARRWSRPQRPSSSAPGSRRSSSRPSACSRRRCTSSRAPRRWGARRRRSRKRRVPMSPPMRRCAARRFPKPATETLLAALRGLERKPEE